MARQGEVWRGKAGHGGARLTTRPGAVKLPGHFLRAQQGMARRGAARRGMANNVDPDTVKIRATFLGNTNLKTRSNDNTKNIESKMDGHQAIADAQCTIERSA